MQFDEVVLTEIISMISGIKEETSVYLFYLMFIL